MSIRAVIFDLDGTLLDTLEDIATAMNETLAAHGLPTHPLDTYRRYVGEGVANLVRRALPADRAELLEPLLAAYRIRYGDLMLRATRPYPGIEALLVALQRRQLKLAVLSNKPDLPTNRLIGHFFKHTFEQVYGERMGLPRKPDPQAALEIAAALGVRPSECALVGDTRIDMQTAKNAKMLPVGVTWGFRDELELRTHGAMAILHHPEQLLEAVTFA